MLDPTCCRLVICFPLKYTSHSLAIYEMLPVLAVKWTTTKYIG